MKTSYEYVVIGVGGVGSAACYWLSRTAGGEVLGLEQFELGHVRGQHRHGLHHRVTGTLRPVFLIQRNPHGR